ncbi:MAG: hypothetical protein E6H07_15250 [Bacteroidetes bacterium]|jgi:hypothetical protein|nr:MAG: hypothetical protein E6H07_15250 [Bacteroidota bacterium]
MPFYYFAFSATMLVLIFIFIRAFILRKESFPVELFNEAQRNENNGYFEEAIISYESALHEAKKTVFLTELKYRIAGKLKVLNTILDYRRSMLFIRQK